MKKSKILSIVIVILSIFTVIYIFAVDVGDYTFLIPFTIIVILEIISRILEKNEKKNN